MRAVHHLLFFALAVSVAGRGAVLAQDKKPQAPLPFNLKVETYRDKDGDAMVFALKLEQPFLAEEFEKSNYLRLSSLSDSAYLIYPRETRFQQKHAEFYGRLRGEGKAGKAKVRLSYEIVSENLDGSRKVDERHADIEIEIPKTESGILKIYQDWARRQNDHFANLLTYYPDESFFEYVLLQSEDRYGVKPPAFLRPSRGTTENEVDLYHIFSGGLSVQQSLQRQTLSNGPQLGDLDTHISRLTPPKINSHDYKKLLEEKGEAPAVPDIAKLIPENQYMLKLNSMDAADSLMELSTEWGANLLRLFTINARDAHLKEKYERQLAVSSAGLSELFKNGVVTEMAVTGSDFFIAEGTDLTLILKVAKEKEFQQAADAWLAAAKEQNEGLNIREFNYRGHRVAARYLDDRTVSSFVISVDGYAVFSNSHVVVRRIIDTLIGASPSLHSAADFQYVSTILPPSDDAKDAYLYASDAFLRHLLSPEFKIAEKRRLLSFNNLVMLNNASLFYRLEHGESPSSLNDLIEGRFVNPSKIVDPTGGAFAFDVERDTCTSSLYNRIKYITPIVELRVERVSQREQEEYKRYSQRYQREYKQYFGPLAARISTGDTIHLETCILPLKNGSLDRDLKQMLDEKPQPISTDGIAKSAVKSLFLTPGRARVASFLTAIPGIQEALEADPTLTDMTWLGDQISLHFCDDDTILEIDPSKLRQLNQMMAIPVSQQSMVAVLISATNLPLYFTVDIEDERKAERLLDAVASQIFLKGGDVYGLKSKVDSYRVPDYKKHRIQVLTFQLYALKIRLHMALVKGKLVAATRPETLREVIDASEGGAKGGETRLAHAMFRVNLKAMDRMKDDVRMYWAEKARLASHRNIMPIYNLIKLYDVPVGEVNRLSDAKYGVTYFCPGGGEYVYDKARDQVSSTAFGNRQNARQDLTLDGKSGFDRFFNGLDEVNASLRFTDEATIATVEIVRSKK
jgi:hypothetical protein